MRMTKKVLSIVLAVMMVVSMMSVMAVSASAVSQISNATELSNACLTGGEYELTADITTNYNYLDADLIIHGNGHTIKSGSEYSVFYWGNDKNADLTLDNVTLDGDGKTGNAVDVNTGDSANSGCNVTFNNVTCKNFISAYAGGVGAVYLFGRSNGSFTNCTFTNNSIYETAANGLNGADIWFGAAGNLAISGGSYDEVYVNGGTASATVSNGAQIASMAAVSTSTVAVTDSTVTKLYVADKNNVTVSGQSTVSILNGFKPTEDEVLDDYPAVAQVGTTKYATLEKAFAAAKDGNTITLLADCSGNGIKVPQGKFATGLTVDFAGHTYTVDGTTVGSTGTETQGFQLLKNNKITFQNGTIKGSTQKTATLKFLIQNYSDLTLDKMNLELVGKYYNQYTLSNNNGNIVINDSTINAPTYGGVVRHDVNSYAFDVCRYASYPSVNVTVTGNSTINGDVEVSASKNDPKNGFSLTLESGTMTGNIVLDDSAKTALANAPERVSVNKAADFAQAAPEGYMWKNAVQGVQELTTIPEDDVLTPDLTKESDGNQFGLDNLKYHFGTLLGVQKKDALDGAAKTSENEAQEDGNDLRFIAVLKTDILRNAQDYGFVLAKVDSSMSTLSVADKINALSADGAGKGEKVISAKGSSNTICGDYGKLGTYTSYKYITCAVNSIEANKKVVARFYVKIGGKTYYAQYPQGGNYDGNFTAAVAGMSDLG